MNMLNYSEANNREIGVLFSKKDSSGLLHKKWTIKLGCLFILYSKIDWACKA